MNSSYVCRSCRTALQSRNGALKRSYTRPSFAPKPVLDLRHLRQNPGLYEQNCRDRKYPAAGKNAWRILDLHNELLALQRRALEQRQRNKSLGKEMQRQAGGSRGMLEEARRLKEELKRVEEVEGRMVEEMVGLAMDVPNLSSDRTPVGDEPALLGWINGEMPPANGTGGRSHVDVGRELDILDFQASATTSGWGWYFLKNEGALLEQALIQYALEVARRRGWKCMTPPSLVYEHIASACGFMPRDQNGETQRYEIASDLSEQQSDKRSLVLAGTAEIPFAGSQANQTLKASELPIKVIGPSRCYRAEAGARGVDTKGLYRVHEFTKVEMFAWTSPPASQTSDDRFGIEEEENQSEQVFDDMLDIQSTILRELGLHAKILEMPSTDLGAAASRKVDIEAFFPSRTSINGGYGELTSASTCTDYQSRRLGTRVRLGGEGKLSFPHTLNGTAMAVPRVLACILENHWDEEGRGVRVPACLRKWMPEGKEVIGPVSRK